jgi:hypothetical protein
VSCTGSAQFVRSLVPTESPENFRPRGAIIAQRTPLADCGLYEGRDLHGVAALKDFVGKYGGIYPQAVPKVPVTLGFGGACTMQSHFVQLSFVPTFRITRKLAGTNSNTSATSSPSSRNSP